MNGNPYYSADNGFACASASRGVVGALQEHLNVIIRNEELEVEVSNANIQTEIDNLVEDKDQLEQQKLSRQGRMDELGEELAARNVDLAKLRTKLETPPDIGALSEGGNKLTDIEESIQTERQILADKKVELIGMETQLENPTPTELDDSLEGAPPKKVSIFHLIFAIFVTFIVFGMLCYLVVFYASAGEKSLISESGTADKLINSAALSEAWNAEPKNWLIIFFPFVFIGFALMIHCFFIENFLRKDGERLNWGKIGVGIIGIVIVGYLDFRIAEKISYDKHEHEVGSEGAAEAGDWSLWDPDLILILLLGFVVSLLISFVFYYLQELWKSVRPDQGIAEKRDKQIESEKNPRKVQLATLGSEIQQIEHRIGELEERKENYAKQIEQAFKHPIEIKIARLESEKEHLENSIGKLDEEIESLQMEINQCEAKIEGLLKRLQIAPINVKKLEAQASEFITGWCRYVAQTKTDLPDSVPAEIEGIHAIKDRTLQAYKDSLTTV